MLGDLARRLETLWPNEFLGLYKSGEGERYFAFGNLNSVLGNDDLRDDANIELATKSG